MGRDRILGINKHFLKDVSVVTIGKLISVLIKFLLRIFILRLLTKEDYGVISTLSAFVVYFDLLADFSTHPIVNKEMIEKVENKNKIFATYFLTKIILGFVSIVSFLTLSYFMGYFKYQDAIIFIALNIFFNSLANVPEIFWQTSGKFKKLSLINIFSVSIGTSLSAIIIFFRPHFKFYFLSILLASTIALFLKFFSLRKDIKFHLLLFKDSLHSILPLIKKSFPLTLGSLLYLICYRSDVIILEKIDSLTNVAEYNAAFAVLDQIADVVWAQFLVVLYPKMVQMHLDSKNNFNKKLGQVILGLIPIIIGATMVSYFISPFMFKLIFGAKYETSGHFFTFLIPAQGMFILFSLFLRIIIIKEKLWIYPIICGLGAILSISLNYYLIPLFSKMGAVYTAFSTGTFIALLALAYVGKDLFLSKKMRS